MNITLRRFGPLALCTSLAMTACAPGLQAQRPYAAPSAQELIDVLHARQAALRTLNIQTRTTSWLGGDRFRASILILADRDGRLRFEAEVSLQGTVAILVTEGKNFSFLDKQHHIFRTGPACAGNAALLIHIPLLPREIAAILLGDALLLPDMKPLAVAWDPARGADVLELEGPAPADGASNHLWVTLKRTKKSYNVVAIEGQAAGVTARWRVAYDDFDTVNGFPIPSEIRFAAPGFSFDEGVEIEVKGDRIVNTPLRAEAFVLAAPPGARVEAVPCQPH